MKKIYEDIKKFFDSNFSSKILYILGTLVLAFIIFSLGVTVGVHKASFGRNWGENYERNFGFRPDRSLLGKDNFPNANGAVGKIIKISLPTIIVQDKDSIEKVIVVNDKTQIQEMRGGITASDLKLDDFIVAIGAPNTQGQIEAKFIRVMPIGMPVPPMGGVPPIK